MEQILLVEDDVATANWLAALLTTLPGTQPPTICTTAQAALDWLEQHRPDIVLADLGLPDRPGIDVIRAATERYPECDVLVITVFGDEAHVMAALAAGASGYLVKDASLTNIHEHLAHLRNGGSPMTPRIARMLIRQYQGKQASPAEAPAPGQRHDLSSREIEVLTGIAKGFSYIEVATALAVSTNTVRTHIKRIYQKLSVNSRSEAVYEYNQLQSQRGQPPLQ
jgi:DNA-binding NarL/FixJ family response regulator